MFGGAAVESSRWIKCGSSFSCSGVTQNDCRARCRVLYCRLPGFVRSPIYLLMSAECVCMCVSVSVSMWGRGEGIASLVGCKVLIFLLSA